MQNITALFNKFVGKEVFSPSCPVTMPDPVISEIVQLAEKNGLNKVRVLYPNSMVTMDYWEDRLNIHVEKSADGKYRVAKDFSIG